MTQEWVNKKNIFGVNFPFKYDLPLAVIQQLKQA